MTKRCRVRPHSTVTTKQLVWTVVCCLGCDGISDHYQIIQISLCWGIWFVLKAGSFELSVPSSHPESLAEKEMKLFSSTQQINSEGDWELKTFSDFRQNCDKYKLGFLNQYSTTILNSDVTTNLTEVGYPAFGHYKKLHFKQTTACMSEGSLKDTVPQNTEACKN